MLNDIMAFLFPDIKKCISCKEEIKGDLPLCEECEEAVTYYSEYTTCHNCGRFYHGPICQTSVSYMAVAIYEEHWKELIHRFKFNNHQYMAKGLARKMYDRLQKSEYTFDTITYIPVSKKTLRDRGFDQSRLLALELGKITGKPVVKSLSKKGMRPAQHTLSLRERMGNWDGEFTILPEVNLDEKDVLLVDDIFTTGNTLYFAIKELERGRFRNIKSIVLAN